MLEGKALDQFMDRFWGEPHAETAGFGHPESNQNYGQNTYEDDLEEYELKEDGIIIQPIHKGRIEKRTWIGLIMFLAFVPLILFILVHKFHGRHDVVISLLVLAYSMIPFFMVFEGRKPQVRELVVLATMVALATAGRAAFFMIPSFKPIIAIVIISAIAFGGEAGFLVGAMTMVVSNFLFGQGPWTPWQMFAMGFIGFLSGILYRIGLLPTKRLSLCIYGFLVTVFIYGGIMNPAALFMSVYDFTWEGLLAIYISGIPVDLVHASSTFIFLWIGAKPLLEKLQRIKIKYDLMR